MIEHDSKHIEIRRLVYVIERHSPPGPSPKTARGVIHSLSKLNHFTDED